MASTSTSLIAHFDAKMAQVYGAYLWAIFLLAAAISVMLLRSETQGTERAKPAALGETQSDGAAVLQPVRPG
jgi:hypothetical protein